MAAFCNLLKSCQAKKNSWQMTSTSENMEDAEGEVIEIIPMDEYDFTRAKAKASLQWILCKAYQDMVPAEFQDPFYDTSEGGWQIKPRLANLLASSEVYCQACKTMFGENASQWTGHWSIIQVLSRKGIYAGSSGSVDVTETILMQSAPFKLKAHLALIDALMLAFTREVMSVERVTKTVRRFASFNASSELPGDTEDAILFWVSKVCVTVQRQLESAQDTILEGDQTSQKVRIVNNKTKESVSVPIMESLLEDMGDGCCVATLLSFYCPQILHLQDVCLKSNVGIADSLYNLRLIRSFCERHLPFRVWHFSYEDVLYMQETIRLNIMTMLAELFYWFEIKTLPIVTGAGFTPAAGQGDGSQFSVSSRVPSVAISNVTKQSFQRQKPDMELRSSNNLDLHKMSPSASVPPRAPLLHKRLQPSPGQFQDDQTIRGSKGAVRRTGSLTSQDVRSFPAVPRQSMLAWSEKNAVDQSQGSTNLLANVSIDSEMNASFSSGSIDLGDLDNSPRTDRSHFDDSAAENTIHFSLQSKKGTPFPVNRNSNFPEQSLNPQSLELESVNSNFQSNGQATDRQDELSHDSAFHSPKGDDSEPVHISPRPGSLEPLMPARLKPSKEKTNNHSKEEERDETPKRKTPSPPKMKKVVQIDPQLAIINRSDVSESTETITPIPALHDSRDNFQTIEAAPVPQSPKKFEAFFIRGSVSDSEQILTHRSDATVAESYTVDQIRTPEDARAAGIPVIEDLTPRQFSREGSVASSRSSDFSDHESHKIHSDHKSRETDKALNNNNDVSKSNENVSNVGQFIFQKPVLVSRPEKDGTKTKPIHATNFAQIRQMKQFCNVDNSGFVYMQMGQDDERKPSLKDAFQKKQQVKKVDGPAGSPRRTWQVNTNAGQTSQPESSPIAATGNDAASQELLKIKMKLEEKRKAIERKKHTQEIQQQKMRQRLGKAAFLHVVAKPKEDSAESGPGLTDESPVPKREPSGFEMPLSTISESSMTSSVTSSASSATSSPLRSPAHVAKHTRPFSRDDIQQTIENVKNKWFDENSSFAPTSVDKTDYESQTVPVTQNGEVIEEGDRYVSNDDRNKRPVVFDRRSVSVERVTSLDSSVQPPAEEIPPQQPVQLSQPTHERRSMSVERPVAEHSASPVLSQAIEKRSASVERESRKDSQARRGRSDSYDEYNNSLDKLNQSLTELQGEIMKLSLKQRKPESSTAAGDNLTVGEQRSRSKSPPSALDVRQKRMPERGRDSVKVSEQAESRQPSHSQGQGRSASEPRQLPPEYEQIGNYQSQTLPRPQTYQPSQVPSYMMPNQVTMAGPAGPIYGTPNQYIPGPNQGGIPPTAQQYGSYLMGPSSQPSMVPIQPPISSPYQHSPPQMFPGAQPVYQPQHYAAQHMMSPQSQPYSVYTSPTQFQPIPPHLAGTYSSPAQQPVQYTPPSTQAVPFNVGNQPAPTFQQQTQPDSQPAVFQQAELYDNSLSDRVGDISQPSKTVSSHKPEQRTEYIQADISRLRSDSSQTGGSVTFAEEAESSKSDTSGHDSAVIADFAQILAKPENKDMKEDSVSDQTLPQDTSAVGFVIGQDETSLDQTAEQEMLKKKEKLEKMRQKRLEEQERKRQKIEQDMSKKREAERLKQEEADRRKSEEKARREQIFKQYLEKKEEEEEGLKPLKPKQKQRPKSMFVRAAPEVMEANSSLEDISSRAFTVPVSGGTTSAASKGPRKVPAKSASMRKAVSMNTLHHNQVGVDGKSLAFGGLTHRRPPSPDLYRTKKVQKNNEGSDAGSAHSGEYAGPKLFVKPSAKSNRHIIINAISHCCLAGSVNTEQKNKVLEEIAKSNAKHFIILFRDSSCGYRGLYGFDPDTEDCWKIIGVGPRTVHNDMVEKYFKYNSGAKSFSEVSSTKHISVSIDAVSLQNTVWKQSKVPAKAVR